MESLEAIRKAQRVDGPAMVLAMGTIVPENCVDQDTFADYYFRVTKNEHMTELKEKMRRMCAKSTIKQRYLHLTKEILTANPNMCINDAPSLSARLEMLVVEIPKIGKDAAVKAIAEWGHDKSQITHLIFCSTGGSTILSGGPYWELPLGRRDSKITNLSAFDKNIPAPNSALQTLIIFFSRQGLDETDLVALSVFDATAQCYSFSFTHFNALH